MTISRDDYEAICDASKKASTLEEALLKLIQADDPLLVEIAKDIQDIFRPEVSDRLMRLSIKCKTIVNAGENDR